MGGTLPRTATGLAGATALGAGLVLAGWASGATLLTTWGSDGLSSKVTTAVALVVLSAGLFVPHRGLRTALAVTVLLVVGATLVQYPTGLDLGLDELFVADPRPGDGAPGRMTVPTGVALCCLAAAQLLLARRRWAWAQGLSLVSLAIGAIALLGHVLTAAQDYAVVPWAHVSLPSSVFLTTLSLAHLALVPDGVVPWTVTDPGPGARLMRRFAPIALLVLPALGWLRISLADAGLIGERSGIALVLAVFAALILGTTYGVARRLDDEAEAADAARDDLRRLNATLTEGRDEAWARAELLSRSLEEEQARFERAVGRIHDLFWTVEVLDDGELLVQYATSSARLLLGGDLPAGSDPIAELGARVHPDDVGAREEFERHVLRGEPAEVELRVCGLDGVTRWVWVRGLPRREGDRLFYDGISTDVSDRRALADQREALLRLERERVEKLRSLGRMRDEFISVAGHELRTPLTAIHGYATRLLADDGLTAEQERAVRVIVNRSVQVTTLVEEFFEVAKLNAGMTRLSLLPLDLGTVAHEVALAHQAAAADAGVTLAVDVLPCPVLADEESLRRVLDKLVDTAVRYTPSGERVRIVARSDGGRAVVSVVDAGVAMSPDQVAQVFDHLFTGATPQERGSDGARLGLAVVKALVEAQGGTVRAAPAAGGHGTAFTVDLPVLDPASAPPPPASRVLPRPGAGPAGLDEEPRAAQA